MTPWKRTEPLMAQLWSEARAEAALRLGVDPHGIVVERVK